MKYIYIYIYIHISQNNTLHAIDSKHSQSYSICFLYFLPVFLVRGPINLFYTLLMDLMCSLKTLVT